MTVRPSRPCVWNIVQHVTDALPLRIFLASPGDLETEREAIRRCVDQYNLLRGPSSNIRYEVLGWERVRGTARRPQEAIDELISESHFVVALFKGSWGSEPGGPWGYTSGTEEELFTGLIELGQPEQPMRDVWVAFLENPSPADEITSLRRQMSTRHSMMYESIANVSDLKEKFMQRLDAWEPLAGVKLPRHIDLVPSSGRDVLRATNRRLQGEKLVELGQAVAGVEALKEAAALGGPLEHLAYARFLARHGDLDEAYLSTQRAIDYFTNGSSHLYTPLAAEAFAAQAGALRRQGRYIDAIGRLEQARTLLLDEQDAHGQRVHCRILDDLGLAYQQIGDLAAARRSFEAANAARVTSLDLQDVCQSKINLARLEVREGNLDSAVRYAEEVLADLNGTPPTALHANAELLAAQVRLRQGRPQEGIQHAVRALSVNEQISSRNGQAISRLLLAQCCRAAGFEREAREHALACIELNEGNAEGARRAQWIIDRLDEGLQARQS
jgi:tetratricopeptide (TPR) repeat protein